MDSKKMLIATGAPLAIACLGWALWNGGIYAFLAMMGTLIAFRTLELVYERS